MCWESCELSIYCLHFIREETKVTNRFICGKQTLLHRPVRLHTFLQAKERLWYLIFVLPI